jgi:hypothetical protein
VPVREPCGAPLGARPLRRGRERRTGRRDPALCSECAAPLPALASPAPPTATPAAGERRPGGRSGLGRERRKVSGGGGARWAPECRVRGEDAPQLAEGERPRALGRVR